jgi:glycosyltransferase involved in cell wall biosynthesis
VRVLFVTHNFPRFSGDLPGNFLLNLAHALAAEEVEVRVIAPHAAGLADSELVDGIPVARFRYAAEHRETLAYSGTMAAQVRGSFRAQLELVSFIRAASGLLRQHSSWADVVHAHWWFPSGLAATRRAVNGKPLVVTLHGSDVRFARGFAPRRLMRKVLSRSVRTTTVSAWLANEAARLSRDTHPVVAPMPVPPGLFAPAGAGRDGLVFVGKLDAQKGPDVLLDALALLPKSVTATFVGDGPLAKSLRARTATLGLSSRVQWMGAVPHKELPPYLQRARLAIAPATAPEGLGLAAVEALLCETPAIVSSTGGLTEVVEDGVTGRVVPPLDASALAAAIEDALGDPARLSRWGREGRVRMLERYDASACAARYAAIYRDAARAAT